VGLVDGRVTHPFTQKISQSHGFAPVGFLPMMAQFGDSRESLAWLVQYFGDALQLRRNHPRIVPEAYQLAVTAMENVGISPDVVVDEEESPYPHVDDFEVQELSADGYSGLLRIERGRVRRREVFGPLSLHCGFFKIRAQSSSYLIARKHGHVVGAIGYTHDELERNVRVFEMIHLDDEVIRFLLEQLEQRYRDTDVAAVQIGVSAHATRMQRTLLELGFLPAAYVPAHAFHRVERIDVITFLRLLEPLELGELKLISPTKEIAELVIDSFARREVFPELRAAVDRIDLFAGLSEEQTLRFAGICGHATFEPGERLFEAGGSSDRMFLVIDGEVERLLPDGCTAGVVGAGQCIGEAALLSGAPHAVGAVARSAVQAGVVERGDLAHLVRQRPDIGVALYRNLAEGVGARLQRLDLDHTDRSDGAD
jgi:CRP-like cAMP-binding protein